MHFRGESYCTKNATPQCGADNKEGKLTRRLFAMRPATVLAIGLMAGTGTPAAANSYDNSADNPESTSAAPTSAGTASQSGVDVPSAEEEKLRADYERYDIPEETQDTLIAKLKAGERLDAFDPDADPTSTESLGFNDGYTEEISRYDDGSYVVTSTEVPSRSTSEAESQIHPLSTVESCEAVWTNGSWKQWRNCEVKNNWGGAINISFVATFENSNTTAKITNAGMPSQTCLFFKCTHPDVWIGRGEQSHTTAAWAQAQSTVSDTSTSFEVWVQLRVNSNGYWTENA